MNPSALSICVDWAEVGRTGQYSVQSKNGSGGNVTVKDALKILTSVLKNVLSLKYSLSTSYYTIINSKLSQNQCTAVIFLRVSYTRFIEIAFSSKDHAWTKGFFLSSKSFRVHIIEISSMFFVKK